MNGHINKYIQHIPTPEEPIPVKEFLESYFEAFDNTIHGVFSLKNNYSFNGWGSIITDGFTLLHDSDGKQLTSFTPLVTFNVLEAKHYLTRGHNVGTYYTDKITEEAFEGYHKYLEGDKYTAIAVVPEVSISTYEITIVGGNVALPI